MKTTTITITISELMGRFLEDHARAMGYENGADFLTQEAYRVARQEERRQDAQAEAKAKKR